VAHGSASEIEAISTQFLVYEHEVRGPNTCIELAIIAIAIRHVIIKFDFCKQKVLFLQYWQPNMEITSTRLACFTGHFNKMRANLQMYKPFNSSRLT
jgi:hypothetical protein